VEVGAYEIALIGVGGAVVGALLGAWIAYHFSLRLADINVRREANRRLIATFHRELADIYPTPINWPDDIHNYLSSKFTTLQAVVGEFRHYLPVQEWEAFDSAWFNYYCSTGREVDKSCQSYLHYMNFESTTNDQEPQKQDGQKTFKHNVDQILKFAKKT
jgi:hypothetical protein